MADGLYTRGLEQFGLAGINWESDDIKMMFMAPAYTPDYDAHQYVSDISASRASGTTDVTLTSPSVNIATGTVRFDTADVSVANETTSTDKVSLYKSTGNDATSPLIGCFAISEGTLSPVDGTLTITVPANGFFGLNSA